MGCGYSKVAPKASCHIQDLDSRKLQKLARAIGKYFDPEALLESIALPYLPFPSYLTASSLPFPDLTSPSQPEYRSGEAFDAAVIDAKLKRLVGEPADELDWAVLAPPGWSLAPARRAAARPWH